MAQTPEGKLQEEVKKYLESKGAITYKNQATKFSKAGYPDMMVWYRGVGFLLEFKVKGNYPSVIQKAWSHKLAAAGVIDVIAYSLDQVEEVIKLIDIAHEDTDPLALLKLRANEERYEGKTK
jgi:hypothetical protein